MKNWGRIRNSYTKTISKKYPFLILDFVPNKNASRELMCTCRKLQISSGLICRSTSRALGIDAKKDFSGTQGR
jgi:hypothetical protein